eukprot:TRINITY_DN10423_c0_g1_i1.p1 TRINITY_DN10423_c0_g1~~TRINITY_DN10423_c0_g1_i1.p1  ORF type:complete len:346 (+),score=87.59 TRINITY_DN10423_c0_g1_i1:36-1073(+)
MIPTIVQNPHDHPIILLYQNHPNANTKGIHEFISFLESTFPPSNIFKLQNQTISSVMGAIMPIHFQHRTTDYCIYTLLNNNQILLALNHLLHDLKSIDLLLKTTLPLSKPLPPHLTILKRTPDPKEGVPSSPVRISYLSVPKTLMGKLTSQLGVTVNECLFWLLVSSITYSTVPQNGGLGGSSDHQVMCLHNIRKAINKQDVIGGDYTCLVRPFEFSAASSPAWPERKFLPAVRSYFQDVRGLKALLKEADKGRSLDGVWVYDSWLGTDIVCPPFGSPSKAGGVPRVIMDITTLMNLFSFVAKDLAIALDVLEDWKLVIFSDNVVLPPAQNIQKLLLNQLELSKL